MFDANKYAESYRTNGLKEDGSKLRILIVDDSIAQIRLLSRMLSSVGYEIVGEAYDGGNALVAYKQFLPDVVTLDITMPGMEGDEVIKVIIKEYPDAKIVMVTSLAYKKIIADCIRSGAKGYILKPIIANQTDKILETIKKAATEE